MSPRTAFALAWTLLLLAMAGCQGRDVPVQPPERRGPAVLAGTLQIPALDEASGLAASHRDDTLWSHNDSGTSEVLYALGPDGSGRGEVRVRGVENRDWEDIASFVLSGTPYLLIADTGDNAAIYGTYAFHVVEEPHLDEGPADVPVAWSVRFRYPEGSRDCEAVGVDIAAQRVLLLTKRTDPPVLYDLPLRADGALVVATKLTTVPHIPQPTAADLEEDPKYGSVRAQPTALDVREDGRAALVQTYGDTHLFHRDPGQSWADAFAGVPETIDSPQLPQTEAACFVGDAIYLTTEKHPAPLYRIDLPPP